MHPCRTALVGLFVFSCALLANADVSELYNAGDLREDLPAEGPFWWMNERSPFKRAVLGGSNQLDFSNNPFLSGSANSLFENVAPSGFISQQQGNQFNDQNPFFNAGSPSGSSYGYLPPKAREPVTVPCQGQGQVCVARQACQNGFILAQNVQNAGRGQNCQVDSEVCCRVQVPVPTTTQRPSIPCNQPNNFCVPAQACSNNGIIIGQNRLQAAPRCFAPDVCCRFQPEPTISESTVLTNEGYVIRVPENPLVSQPNNPVPTVIVPRPPPVIVTTQRYVPPPVVTTQRPYAPPVIIQTTRQPYQANGYIPPRDNEIGSPSNDRPSNILPPIRGEGIKPLPIFPQSTNQNDVITIPQACPAAMNCTEEQFCTATGVISKSPVVLTRQQAEFRVPMTDCRDSKRGFIGKCCRDPDYVDPWPATILGQYNAEILGFDDGSYKPERFVSQQNTVVRGQNQLSRPIAQTVTVQQQSNTFFDQVGSASGSCGIRNENAIPHGAGQFDTGFGEFTWQAMVLLQANKSLLCGGVIVDQKTVATAAHCVHGVNHRDLKVKCGEWKLGLDDEPKTFQIVGVKAITFHPAYNPSNYDSDVALLHLDEQVRYDSHVGPICLEDEYQGSSSSEDCVTTGWGKDVLRIHLQGAIMKQVPMQVLNQNECSSALSGYGYNPQSSVCCRPRGGDACQADVGSALACRTNNGNYVLRGVYSTETECASSNQVVTFAKMDANWVRQSIRNPQPQATHQIQTQTVYNQEVIGQSNNPQVFAIPTQAPFYLPPL